MTDLSKYKAFPEGYIIPKGIKVISLVDDYGLLGVKGVTIEEDSIPFCSWEGFENTIAIISYKLAPVHPQDHPDYKMETLYIDPSKPAEKREFNFQEPEWHPKTGEVVNVSNMLSSGRAIYLFTNDVGHWCISIEDRSAFNKGETVSINCWGRISKTTPLKLTRAEIAEKFGTDNFEIID
jgi:hypothetical protein